MGNCLRTPEKLTAEIVPNDGAIVYPAVRLHGSPESVLTAYIRFALLHEAVRSDSVTTTGMSPATEGDSGRGSEPPPRFRAARFSRGREEGTKFVVRTPPAPARVPEIPGVGYEVASGSQHALLRFIDSRFPGLSPVSEDATTSLVVWVTRLQHKSMTWHVERMVRWAEDLVTRGGRKAVDPKMGNWRMETMKFGRSYSQLLEVMIEHAQMEEKVLFPIFDRADRGREKYTNLFFYGIKLFLQS